jgi:hypothetical protein
VARLLRRDEHVPNTIFDEMISFARKPQSATKTALEPLNEIIQIFVS